MLYPMLGCNCWKLSLKTLSCASASVPLTELVSERSPMFLEGS